jgi:hypothetical protein
VRRVALVGGVLLAAWPRPAAAINGARPRVPPSFYGQECITVIGPGSPLLEVGVTVPYEDIELTDDELPDSRTLGLYAFGRDLPPGQELPNWVLADDVARALEAGVLEAPPPSDAVLPSSAWTDAVFGVVEARQPIACDSAGPWPWDTREVPVGAYVLWGYTFEPPLNLWTPRPGVVRVVDAEGEGPPAVALQFLDDRLEFGVEQGLRVTGCVSADPGTEVRLAWARAAEPDTWTVFDVLQPEDGTFDTVLFPPDDALYEALYVRAEATDPSGRTFTHHARGALVVLAECVESPLTLSDVADGCGVAESVDAAASLDPAPCVPVAGDDGQGEDEPSEAEPDPGSGGCSFSGRHSGWVGGLLVLIAARRRGRLGCG